MAPRNHFDAGCPAPEDHVPEINWSPQEVVPVKNEKPVPLQIVWRNVTLFGVLHLASVYALFLVPSAQPLTWLYAYVMFLIGAVSITAGAHRLWSHRSYKAKVPLRIILMLFNLTACQNHIIEWARDHRGHHKYSETSADPHNAKRGFFFAHVGWLLCKKHPDVIEKGSQLDYSDLYADPVLRFQKRFYKPLVILMTFILPTVIPWYFWGESLWNAYFISTLLRYCIILNNTWLVNSFAHMWGMRPYDKHINPSENMLVTIGALGEGFHNYHHTFPHDYATSEFGWKYNPTTMFINFFAMIGWAYDLKTMSKQAIDARKRRTGCLSEDGKQVQGQFLTPGKLSK